jgi:hypothetical protein
VPDRYRTPRPPRGNAPTRIACVMTRRRLWRRHLPWASHAMRCVVTTCCVALLFALPIEWRLYMLADPPSAGLACCPVAVVALGMVLGGLACVRASSAGKGHLTAMQRVILVTVPVVLCCLMPGTHAMVPATDVQEESGAAAAPAGGYDVTGRSHSGSAGVSARDPANLAHETTDASSSPGKAHTHCGTSRRRLRSS